MDNCYQVAPPPEHAQSHREFDSPVFAAWVKRLSGQGLCQMLVSLLLKLERLAQAPVEGPRALAILQQLAIVLRDVADDLPKGRLPPTDSTALLSLEQRLCCVMFKNLKLTLERLDRSARGMLLNPDAERAWLVGEMFDWLGRQIELGVLRGSTWPPHTWQELHDLFFYFSNRMKAARPQMAQAVGPHSFDDPQTAYKRLLILGLYAEQRSDTLLGPDQAQRLDDWARASTLEDPGLYFGYLGTYLVEVSRDTPPRLVTGALGSANRAWVLRLPTDLLAIIEANGKRFRPGAD
ncbi:hypothetical protein [uncultured Lamprocystis sp.]|jgi:hypothetical protein|uniref:hypothetical protein n=1 Tax=uncultured Lamprocystis sp. TaxID=543132 RepID=UPI0025D9B4FC|nr:hypothetical protein [uncultured Lamprocystis sp.]